MLERRWTFTLIATCTIIFILQLFGSWWKYFAFTPAYAFSRPWTFVTSIFLHQPYICDVTGSCYLYLSHIAFNMFALLIFGIYLEGIVKPRDFLLIFFLSGIIGNIAYMLTASDPTIPAIGASGAIYGIIGALAAIRPTAMVWVGYVPIPMVLAAILWGVTEFLGIFIPSSVAHVSHLGGLIIGAIYGLVLRRRKKRVTYLFSY